MFGFSAGRQRKEKACNKIKSFSFEEKYKTKEVSAVNRAVSKVSF